MTLLLLYEGVESKSVSLDQRESPPYSTESPFAIRKFLRYSTPQLFYVLLQTVHYQ